MRVKKIAEITGESGHIVVKKKKDQQSTKGMVKKFRIETFVEQEQIQAMGEADQWVDGMKKTVTKLEAQFNPPLIATEGDITELVLFNTNNGEVTEFKGTPAIHRSSFDSGDSLTYFELWGSIKKQVK